MQCSFQEPNKVWFPKSLKDFTKKTGINIYYDYLCKQYYVKTNNDIMIRYSRANELVIRLKSELKNNHKFI